MLKQRRVNNNKNNVETDVNNNNKNNVETETC